MANDIVLNPGVGGDTLAAREESSVKHQQMLLEFDVAGVSTKVAAAAPLPVVHRRRGAADHDVTTDCSTTLTTVIAQTVYVEDGVIINLTGTQQTFTLKDASDVIFMNAVPVPPNETLGIRPMTLAGGYKVQAGNNSAIRVQIRGSK